MVVAMAAMAVAVAMSVSVAAGVAVRVAVMGVVVTHRPGSMSSSTLLRRERDLGGSLTPTRQKKVKPWS